MLLANYDNIFFNGIKKFSFDSQENNISKVFNIIDDIIDIVITKIVDMIKFFALGQVIFFNSNIDAFMIFFIFAKNVFDRNKNIFREKKNVIK